jgi:hypothetical protein
VDEREWLCCRDPDAMLAALRDRASDRTLRLFACACCRRIRHLLSHERSRQAVECGERYADGMALPEQLPAVRAGAEQVAAESRAEELSINLDWNALASEHQAKSERGAFASAARAAAATVATEAAEFIQAAPATVDAAVGMAFGLFEETQAAEREAQSNLLRDIIGNPFRPFQSRNFPAHVLGLAQSCYAAFPLVSDDFLVLADALEELGEEAAAAHCRQTSHVKGCHVLDWVLGEV